MTGRHAHHAGFSAVELLITLFIATAFIATGYQLYSIIIKDGGAARMRAKASNIAYDNLRRYAPQATNPCTVFTPTPTPSAIPASTLPSATITVTPTCPYASSTGVTKLQVSVKYGPTPQEEVIHALFVTK